MSQFSAPIPQYARRPLTDRQTRATTAQLLSLVVTLVLVAYVALVPIVPPLLEQGVLPLDMLFPLASLLLIFTISPRQWPTQVSLLVFLGVTCASVMQRVGTPYFSDCFLRYIRLVEIFGPFFLAMAALDWFKNYKWLSWMFYFSGGASVAAGIAFFFLGINFRDEGQYGFIDGHYVRRAAGIFGDSSGYGHMITLWACYVLLSITFRARWVRFPGLLILSLCAVVPMALIYSGSRSAFVIMGLCTGFSMSMLAWRIITAKQWHITVGTVMIIVAMLLGAGVAGYFIATSGDVSVVLDRMLDVVLMRQDASSLSSGRFDNWDHHIQLFFQNPLLGVGYKSMSTIWNEATDNVFLSVSVEMGTLGLASYVTLISLIIAGLWKLRKVAPAEGNTMLALWGLQMTHGMLVDINTFWGSMPVLMILTGTVLAGVPVVRRVAAKRPALMPPHLQFNRSTERPAMAMPAMATGALNEAGDEASPDLNDIDRPILGDRQ